MNLWISLSSPDASTASRHWILCGVGKYRKSIRLPIKYEASNRFMVFIESCLERMWYRHVDVAY